MRCSHSSLSHFGIQRKVLLGIAELNMLLTGNPRKIYYEEVYPDRCESLDEFLQLEERLNDDEE